MRCMANSLVLSAFFSGLMKSVDLDFSSAGVLISIFTKVSAGFI